MEKRRLEGFDAYTKEDIRDAAMHYVVVGPNDGSECTRREYLRSAFRIMRVWSFNNDGNIYAGIGQVNSIAYSMEDM